MRTVSPTINATVSPTINDLALKHWQLKMDVDGLLWAFADRQGESVNSLSPDMLRELADILTFAEQQAVTGRLFVRQAQRFHRRLRHSRI
jgi:hypothetical protein